MHVDRLQAREEHHRRPSRAARGKLLAVNRTPAKSVELENLVGTLSSPTGQTAVTSTQAPCTGCKKELGADLYAISKVILNWLKPANGTCKLSRFG
jgi:hypothetical protein